MNEKKNGEKKRKKNETVYFQWVNCNGRIEADVRMSSQMVFITTTMLTLNAIPAFVVHVLDVYPSIYYTVAISIFFFRIESISLQNI